MQKCKNWLHNISSQNSEVFLFLYFQSFRWSLFAWDTKPIPSSEVSFRPWLPNGTFSQLQPFNVIFLHFGGLVAFVLSSCGLWLYLSLQSGSCDTSWDCSGYNLHNTNWVHFLHFGVALGSWKGWLVVLCPVFYRLYPAVGENEPLWFTITCASWAAYVENLERKQW